jgi:hypothetical protein
LGISRIIPQHIDISKRQHYMLCFYLDNSVIEVYNQVVLWAGLNIPPPKYSIALASKSGSSRNLPNPVLQLSQRNPLNSPVPWLWSNLNGFFVLCPSDTSSASVRIQMGQEWSSGIWCSECSCRKVACDFRSQGLHKVLRPWDLDRFA